MSPKDDKAKLQEIHRRFQLAEDAESDARLAWLEDIKFAHVPGYQWPDQLRKLRENPTSPRPCLEINVAQQHVFQITNDIKQNRPEIKVRPVSPDASNEVAEIFNGVIRHIWERSDGDTALDVAVNGEVAGGWGYIRITTEVTNPATNEQELRIVPIYNTLAAYADSNNLSPVGMDNNCFFFVDNIPRKKFEADYGKESFAGEWKESSYGDANAWVSEDTVRVCEYFELKERSVNVLRLIDGSEMIEADYWAEYQADADRPPVIANREDVEKYVQWTKCTSFKILEENEFLSDFIPFARFPGIYTDIEGKRYWKGVIRDMRDPQRSFNYWWSTFTETVGLQSKAPWLVAAGAIDGYEAQWWHANSSNQPYLLYNAVDESGQPLPPPQRNQLQAAPQGVIQGMQMAADHVKMSSGQFDASMGAQSNETSGRAIVARDRQSDNATYHYVDGAAAGVRHLGRILISAIPKYYDTKRVLRIIGEDGEIDTVSIDPEQKEAVREIQDSSGEVRKIYNLNVGRYDVISTSGPSFNTRRQEAVEAMTTVLQGNPQMMQLIGDIWVRNQDWPGSEEMAERLKTLLPPQIQQLEAGQQQLPPQVQQAMQQMQAQMQQMGQALQMAQAEVQKLSAQQQSKAAEIEIKKMEVYMKQLDVETTKIEAAAKATEAQARAQEAQAENIRSMTQPAHIPQMEPQQ